MPAGAGRGGEEPPQSLWGEHGPAEVLPARESGPGQPGTSSLPDTRAEAALAGRGREPAGWARTDTEDRLSNLGDVVTKEIISQEELPVYRVLNNLLF